MRVSVVYVNVFFMIECILILELFSLVFSLVCLTHEGIGSL